MLVWYTHEQYTPLVLSDTIDSAIISIVLILLQYVSGCPSVTTVPEVKIALQNIDFLLVES